MNIGIFSGSFNPIHLGHLMLANYITEFTDIDEVWFLVTPQNPLKDTENIIDENHRLKMVEYAVEDFFPKIKADDFEFSLPRPSYTIDTLSALQKKYPDYSFSLIIGADNWSLFYKWKDYKNIVANYNIYIYPRLESDIEIPHNLIGRVKIMDAPVIEISSTFIRENLSEGKDLRAFLPSKVYDYIVSNGLYK